MKTKLLFLALIACCLSARARLTRAWTYQQLSDSATLIVVATPVKEHILNEEIVLPNIQSVAPNGVTSEIMAKGVETSFTVSAVFKGQKEVTNITLHHYLLVNPKDAKGRGAPGLVVFTPGDHKQFLMFLTLEKDGRYVAVSGQTDPNDSIKVLDNPEP